ncbi:MAG: 1-deoxy-D-xylulose-5-phosphate synthase [Bacteroidales bacterium]|nr:1-deoxy-D-xylulose-5-phosphate synthase [Bacteroidales bacterium]
MEKLLDQVNLPQDIRGFDTEQLRQLCAEIRRYMLDCCSHNPGHVASSLGAVELIVGLHYIYDTPKDKIVFDVGHQAYAHKILTGRKEAFERNRTAGGISGFPRMEESPYDAFGAGHASTSVSAALGLAEAAKRQGRDEKVVALIGDGALTGGLAFEGLNNAGDSEADLLVILNDNNQSIDSNLGGLHNHLMKLTTNPAYNRMKDRVWQSLGESRTRNFFQRWIRSLKSWAVTKTGGDLFESLGFRYFGPIDGNDIEAVTRALSKLRDMKGPRLLHCYTVKGKGFSPAETDPTVWHAPGKFDPETGEILSSPRPRDRYQDVFGQTLLDLARTDSRVIGITPAMASGCGMSLLAHEMPDRFFDVGIEEEHAVTFSAGLAAGGMRPFCNIYSSFSQRAYDQIIHDLALQGLPVVLCFDRAGLVGEDGATHHGVFDLAAYRSVPGTTICAPRDERELRNAMYTALRQEKGPFIIRYPRGMGEGTAWKGVPFEILEPGRGECLQDGSRIAVLTLGPLAYRALEAARQFEQEGHPAPAVYDLRYLKPLDTALLDEIASRFGSILTVEDGSLKGGLYGAVCEFLAERDRKATVRGIGIPDRFIPQARQDEERRGCGLDSAGILAELQKLAEKD